MSVLDENIIDKINEQASLYLFWLRERDEFYESIPSLKMYDWFNKHSTMSCYEWSTPTNQGSPVIEGSMVEYIHDKDILTSGICKRRVTAIEELYGKLFPIYLPNPVDRLQYIEKEPSELHPQGIWFTKSLHLQAALHQVNYEDKRHVIRLYDIICIKDIQTEDEWPDWLVDKSTWEFRTPFSNVVIYLQNCYWPGAYGHRTKGAVLNTVDEGVKF